jgi:hypothetical protein
MVRRVVRMWWSDGLCECDGQTGSANLMVRQVVRMWIRWCSAVFHKTRKCCEQITFSRKTHLGAFLWSCLQLTRRSVSQLLTDNLLLSLKFRKQLLYSKPTHALLLNTLSHPHFKTLKLLKMFCKNIIKTLHVSVITVWPSSGVVFRT